MSKKTIELRLADAMAERSLRQQQRGHTYGGSWSDKQLETYIRTLEASLLAMPADPPIVDVVTDTLIAECMVSVSDPVRWGMLGNEVAARDMLREFSHALATRLAFLTPPTASSAEPVGLTREAVWAIKSAVHRSIHALPESDRRSCDILFHAVNIGVDAAIASLPPHPAKETP